MNSLLSLKENMFLKIKDKKSISIYRCLKIENIEVEGYQLSSRYHLQSEKNYKKAILEVKKDQNNNISISLYKSIEQIDYDLSLIANLGSETIIYKNNNRHETETQYQIIRNNSQKDSYFKYIEDYSLIDDKIYNTKDANGNLYSIFKKVSPLKIKYLNRIDLFWEYRNILNNKLHIELSKSKNSIIFYQKTDIRRDHIQIINESYHIAKDYKSYDDLKSKYHIYLE